MHEDSACLGGAIEIAGSNTGRMSGVQPLRMIRVLEQLGWTVARSKGSHHALKKPGHPGAITVSVKKGQTLPEGTARGILKQAGVSEDEFFELY